MKTLNKKDLDYNQFYYESDLLASPDDEYSRLLIISVIYRHARDIDSAYYDIDVLDACNNKALEFDKLPKTDQDKITDLADELYCYQANLWHSEAMADYAESMRD